MTERPDLGFPEFTRFFNRGHPRKLPDFAWSEKYDSHPLYH